MRMHRKAVLLPLAGVLLWGLASAHAADTTKLAEKPIPAKTAPTGPATPAATAAAKPVAAPSPAAAKAAWNEPAFFLRDVMPLLTRRGCNAAQCHGASLGQGGMSLSLFGGDPEADYNALTRLHTGRRINRVEPQKSVLLLKATNAIPHTGGARIPADSSEAAMLAAWVAQGAPFGDAKLHRPVSIAIAPKDKTMAKGESISFTAKAVYADGTQRDVTALAAFATTDAAIAAVDSSGKAQIKGFGEAHVSVTFMRRTDTARLTAPQPLPTPFPKVAPNNKIDELVFSRLEKLGFPPSEVCSEEVFLRRVYLDVIGLLPKPEEVRAYMADPDPKKRSKLIDRLLEREEYVDFWALKWSDLLRIKSEYPVRVWPRGVLTYYQWVRNSVAANKPYDQFARELITANGSNFRGGAANYYRAVQKREPQTYAEATSILFMGARLDCARCHSHPTENWGLDDSLGMAAFFAKVAIKPTQEWKEEVVYANHYGAVWHPRSREYVQPKFLGGAALELPRDQDPRPKFAEWLTSPANPWFAKAMANRVWFWLLGRGIVHEPDDFRISNPPSNPELLDYLTQEFVAHKFDIKHMFRLILNSKVYQLSGKATPLNRADSANFSHYHVRRMGAEQVLDAVVQVTGVPDQFASWIPVPPTIMPMGARAAQVFDGDIRNPILDLFGRPPRDTPYECERKLDGSVRQSLHLVNSDHFEGKVAGSPYLAQLLQSKKTDPEIVDELYLSALSRTARAEEKHKMADYMSGTGKKIPPQLETDKKAADDALAAVRAGRQKVNADAEAAEKAAKEAETAALKAKAAAEAARAAQAAAEAAAAEKRKAAAAAKAAKDKITSEEIAATAKSAVAAKKLAEANASLKPPRHQAFQDLLWALMNTKEFLFNH